MAFKQGIESFNLLLAHRALILARNRSILIEAINEQESLHQGL